MRIIWLTLESILPANTGGRIGVFKRLEQLSEKNNEIYLFYPYDDVSEIEYCKELEKFCVKVYAYKRQCKFKTLLSCIKYPYTVASRKIKQMQIDIENCIRENNIDVINIDFPHMVVNVLQISNNYNIPIVLNEHNIEWKFYRQVSKSHSNLLKKLIYFLDSFRLKHYEKRITRRVNFSAVTFVSNDDLKYYQNWIGKSDLLHLVPVGGDEQIVGFETKKTTNKVIVFVGLMAAATNQDAVVWFSTKILPLIQQQVENIKFYIVGKNPAPTVQNLANENIIVTGQVDSVKEYYEMADLVVLPLRYGEGVKVKLIEAMSYAKPIVTTSVGVQGLVVSEYVGFMIDDEETKFAQDCVLLLNDKEKAIITGQRLYDFFLANYTWNKIGDIYQKVMDGVVANNKE